MSAFQEYFLDTLKYRYADFDGRARRSEYWYFLLFNLLTYLGLSMVTGIFAAILSAMGLETLSIAMVVGILILWFLATLVPSLAVAVRRLHDTGKSGWLYLISLIPLGGFVLLIFFLLDGDPGENSWGPNPKDQLTLDYYDRVDEEFDHHEDDYADMA